MNGPIISLASITIVFFECENCTAFNGHKKGKNPVNCNYCGIEIDTLQLTSSNSSERKIAKESEPHWYNYYTQRDGS